MKVPLIDLKIFLPKYRQAILYTMIEGLEEGSAFSFSDDRSPSDIESELASADLSGYRWLRASNSSESEPAYRIERKAQTPQAKEEGCCGCCCGQSEE